MSNDADPLTVCPRTFGQLAEPGTAALCCILIAPMAGCAAPELADLRAYGRRVMPN